MEQNVDFLQTATIVENPSNLEGRWTGIECLTSLTGVNIVDENLTAGSLPWTDDQFPSTMIRVGKFRKVTFTGKAVLYA